jgi:small redox-active disulfide protein 2
MQIKILGPGCPKCQKTEEVVREALAQSGAQAEVEKVTGMMDIASYGVLGTPAVVIDGQVKCVGKIPTQEEVLAWLRQ